MLFELPAYLPIARGNRRAYVSKVVSHDECSIDTIWDRVPNGRVEVEGERSYGELTIARMNRLVCQTSQDK